MALDRNVAAQGRHDRSGNRKPAGLGIALLVAGAVAAVAALHPFAPPSTPTTGVEAFSLMPAAMASMQAIMAPHPARTPSQQGAIYVALMQFTDGGLLEFYNPRPFLITNAQWRGFTVARPIAYYHVVMPVGTGSKGMQLFTVPARTGVIVYHTTTPPGAPIALRF